jgi:hypothetical protein
MSKCRIASIELDDAMILGRVANPDGSNFRKGQVPVDLSFVVKAQASNDAISAATIPKWISVVISALAVKSSLRLANEIFRPVRRLWAVNVAPRINNFDLDHGATKRDGQIVMRD